ncbi:hypothetical protein GZL_02649 [Streptomyces sp. 769]|nr:hypothetical protein GZL_02649 [Streptomyces sp. 769]
MCVQECAEPHDLARRSVLSRVAGGMPRGFDPSSFVRIYKTGGVASQPLHGFSDCTGWVPGAFTKPNRVNKT